MKIAKMKSDLLWKDECKMNRYERIFPLKRKAWALFCIAACFCFAASFSLPVGFSAEEKKKAARTAKSIRAKFVVEDLSCDGCSMKLSTALYNLQGVRNLVVNSENKSVEVAYDPTVLTEKRIVSTINYEGFKIKDSKK